MTCNKTSSVRTQTRSFTFPRS